MTSVAVVGIGKLGLPIAGYLAQHGADVVGIDVASSVVDHVNSGKSPIGAEPGLDDSLADLVAAGRLRATTDYAAIADANIVIVTVPLLAHNGEPDYQHIDAAVAGIAEHLASGALVIFETTLPVGATRNRFLPTLRGAQPDALVAFSPERVSSGRIWRDLDTYPKIVGGVDDASGSAAVEFYAEHLEAEVLALASAEEAELTKLAETTYRDINIAFANELAVIADVLEVDVTAVIAAANSQPYSHIHRPGIGVGGHCIPHYPYLLMRSTVGSDVAATARSVNESMPRRVADLLAETMGGLEGRTIVALGVAYRPGVPESASSPVFAFRDACVRAGATVQAADPMFSAEEIRGLGLEAWEGDPADAYVLITEHESYRGFTGAGYPAAVVYDGRNVLDRKAVEAAGHRYVGTGR